jgi:hypothetical protein
VVEYSGRVENDGAWHEGAEEGELLKDEGIRGVRTMCGSRTDGWSLPCVMSD